MPGASLRASSIRTPSRHRQNNIENQPFELMAIRKNRVSGNMCIGNAVFYYMRPLQALAAYELTHDGCRRDCGDFFRRQGHDVIQELEQADGLGICGR